MTVTMSRLDVAAALIQVQNGPFASAPDVVAVLAGHQQRSTALVEQLQEFCEGTPLFDFIVADDDEQRTDEQRTELAEFVAKRAFSKREKVCVVVTYIEEFFYKLCSMEPIQTLAFDIRNEGPVLREVPQVHESA
jgi:hypothetical protein